MFFYPQRECSAFAKVYYFFILSLCLLVNVQEFLIKKIEVFGFVSYIDEACALLAYLVAPVIIRKKRDIWVFGILFLPILSCIYSFLMGFILWGKINYYAVIIQSVVNFKFFLYFVLFFCAKVLFNDNFERINKIFKLCLFLSLFGVFVNFFFPDDFIYSTYEYALSRQRIIGFQFKPNDLAIFLSLFFSAFLFNEDVKIVKLKWFSLFFILTLIVVSTSRTALLVSIIAIIFYAYHIKSKYTVTKISITLLAFVGLLLMFAVFFFEYFLQSFLFKETISNFKEFSSIETSKYIRFIMVFFGFKLLLNYFPFGTGAGTYGTVMSDDSPVYDMLGISQMEFFQKMEGVYDSNIASIFGEYGVVGVMVFIFFSVKVFGFFANGYKYILYMFILVSIFISFFQPFYSYQVNSINMILFMFYIKAMILKYHTSPIRKPRFEMKL